MAFRGTGLVPFFGPTFSPLFNLRREIDRMFDDMVGSTPTSRWMPAVDVREDDKMLALDIELPGIDPENVEVNVDDGVLMVSGEKRAERQEGEEGRYHVVERSYGRFFRSFQLPQGVDESQITANFNNGVLTVQIPKTALPQPRRIQIGARAGEREVKPPTAREPVSGRTGGAQQQTSGERMAARGKEKETE
jgi:HSP20 family protein